MTITVYYSSVSGSVEILLFGVLYLQDTGLTFAVRTMANEMEQVKKQQQAIFQFLEGNKIQYFKKDITESPDIKEEMRKKVGNPQALPPQVFNGDQYCGDYDAFFNAVEDGQAKKFLKI